MTLSVAEWDQFLSHHPNAHFFQTGAWGELKSRFGWRPVRVVKGDSGAQLLFRRLPFGYTIAYLAKCPGDLSEELLAEVDIVCRQNRAILLKIEPDQLEDGNAVNPPALEGLIPAKPIQPRRTVLLSLEGSDEDILNRMKQKTRYNIRLAEKKGVVVRKSVDVPEFHRMAVLTAERDLFSVHSRAYYQSVYDLLGANDNCALLTAYYERQPLASLFVVTAGETAYYLYGASYNLERSRMPTYLIQWEAMKWAKGKGCKFYDLWGIPDLEEGELEQGFADKDSHDGLWGVYRFKRGFGGEVKRSVGAWDKVYNDRLYAFYSWLMKLRGNRGD